MRVREGVIADLAYAAFHCSSRLALADSMSVEETKREPTTPVDIEGIDSSIAMSLRESRRAVRLRHGEHYRHGEQRLAQIPLSSLNRQSLRSSQHSQQPPFHNKDRRHLPS